MRARVAALLAASVVLLASRSHVITSQGTPGPDFAPGELVLSYSEATLDDERRSRLVDLLPRLHPPERWPTVLSTGDENLSRLVRRVYFPGQAVSVVNRFPKTADALVKNISRVNDVNVERALDPARTVRVPPLPPISAEGDPQSVRVLTASASWSTSDAGRNWNREFSNDGPRTAFGPPQEPAGFSEIAIPPDAPPDAIAALNAYGTVVPAGGGVVLRAPKGSATCVPATDWITSSPHYAAALARVASKKADILAATGGADRLVLIDFNFDGGHGSEVRSAALTVFEAFKIPELGPLIEVVELNPTANGGKARQGLQDIYRDYIDQYGRANGVNDALSGQASNWLVLYNGSGSSAAAQTIDALVLQAAIWKASSLGPWWSLSWWSRTFGVIYPSDWDTHLEQTFATVAAGNDNAVLARSLEPQRNGTNFLSWLNVTHGGLDGSVAGSRTSPTGTAYVDVIAPGCGYSLMPLKPSDSGSSYASPFVAAAAWLKHLLDKGRNDRKVAPADMRRQVWFATSFVSKAKGIVESAGVFDAARLLNDVDRFYVSTATSAAIVPLRDAQIQIQSGACGRYTSQTGQVASFAIAGTAPASLKGYLRRSIPKIPTGEVQECQIDPASFSAVLTLSDGSVKKFNAQQFLADVREVVF